MRPQENGSAELKVVCAGHPLPLRLRQDGTVEAAAEPQPLLGVMEDLELYEQTVTLDPGDVLLCVTDGVTERREGTRMLGDDGLADVLTTCTGLTAGAVAGRIMRAVERFASEPLPTTWRSWRCASQSRPPRMCCREVCCRPGLQAWAGSPARTFQHLPAAAGA